MCTLAYSMERLLLAAIVVLCTCNNVAKKSDCKPDKHMYCATLNVNNARICYKKSRHDLWTATISCINGVLTGPETYICRTNDDWNPSPSSSCGSVGSSQTTTLVTTIIYTTEKEGDSNNTTLFTGKAPASLEDSGSVVVAAVLVSVAVIIAIAAVIVFFLWRRRRLEQQKARCSYSGTSISNRGFEDYHGLERDISLPDNNPNGSVVHEYDEISPENLNVEETARSVIQNIESLPEDQYNGGYGHLNIQTTTFIDNSYSHIAEEPARGDISIDTTYAHTGKSSNAEELKDDSENATTYNHLVTVARKNKGNPQLLKKEEMEGSDDMEVEYNHATAGHLALVHENERDSYSHLNQICKSTFRK